jgi:hypothetical protein
VSDVRNLIEEESHVGQKLLGLMIVKNVHVHTLSSAVRESSGIVLLIDQVSNTRHNHGSREDSLEVSTGHLKDDAHVGGNGSDKSRSALYAAASFVGLGVICRYFKLWLVLVIGLGRGKSGLPSILADK